MDAGLYLELGGHDERFRGWGEEDVEFWYRLSASTPIVRLPRRELHLHHPPVSSEEGRLNKHLLDCIRADQIEPSTAPIGRQDLYAAEVD